VKGAARAQAPFMVSLQIHDPARSADDITRGLGVQPDVSWNVGAPRSRPDGTPMSGKHQATYWGKTFEAGKHPLPSAVIAHWVRQLGPRHAFLRKLSERGAKISFYVTWSAGAFGGDEFAPDLLQEVAAVGAGVAIEVFA